MSIPRDWPAKPPAAATNGIARFQARCPKCDTNEWKAVDF